MAFAFMQETVLIKALGDKALGVRRMRWGFAVMEDLKLLVVKIAIQINCFK